MNVKFVCDSMHRLSDPELVSVWTSATNELARREEARKRRREEWIEHMSWEAYHRGAVEVVGDTVIVAIWKNDSIHMTKTRPIKGDEFDMKTGVAVAYCKAVGMRVPDFI